MTAGYEDEEGLCWNLEVEVTATGFGGKDFTNESILLHGLRVQGT